MRCLRSYAHCIKLDEQFCVLRNFFGYTPTPAWQRPPTGAGGPSNRVCLRLQMERLEFQPRFDLAVVLVGYRRDGTSSFWNRTKEEAVNAALQVARDIYADAGFGIGRITRWHAAEGAPWAPRNRFHQEIWGGSTGILLVENYRVDKSVMNAFIVPDLPELAGHNPHGERGVIVGFNSNWKAMGRTLAHEIGHILISSIGWMEEELGIADPGFLDHNDDANNLMQSGGSGTHLSQWQRHNIRTNGAHGFLKPACFGPVDESNEPIVERVPSPHEEPLPRETPPPEGGMDVSKVVP